MLFSQEIFRNKIRPNQISGSSNIGKTHFVNIFISFAFKLVNKYKMIYILVKEKYFLN